LYIYSISGGESAESYDSDKDPNHNLASSAVVVDGRFIQMNCINYFIFSANQYALNTVFIQL